MDPAVEAAKPQRTALVLAGGGALGAYETGVLQYIVEDLADEMGLEQTPGFDIFCGTSVGALNASSLAAGADDPHDAIRELVAFWRSITFEKILRFRSRELAALVKILAGAPPSKKLLEPHRLPVMGPHPPIAGLFDTSPLNALVSARIPWHRLQANVAADVVHGVALCATEICSGTSIIFYQTNASTKYKTGRDPNKLARRVRLKSDHALASSAIPFIFPSVQIDGVCYTDGALRQNTPLNPALRMGANRVLVISLTPDPQIAKRLARIGCRRNPFPGATFLLGRTVGILLTQSLDYEIKRVNMYNKLIEGGIATYGEDFPTNLDRILGGQRNAIYRPVRTCHVRPSVDLNDLAIRALREAPKEVRVPGLPGTVLSQLMRSASFVESGLLGLLMFTPTFVQLLLEQGYRDAREQRAELARFFAPTDEKEAPAG